MIKSNLEKKDIINLLNTDFIENKDPLIHYAGFEDKSEPRKTFSVILQNEDIDAIKIKIQEVYTQIKNDVAKKYRFDKSYLPFDYIRMDAFYDPETKDLRIIEINKRNAGMHEISEWLDEQCAKALNTEIEFSLNEKILFTQKHMHDLNLDSYDSILYLSPSKTPRWIYFDKIKEVYKKEVIDIFDTKKLKIIKDKLYFRDKEIKAIIGKFNKFPNGMIRKIKNLIESGNVFYVQPIHTRFIGNKKYLSKLNSDSIVKSENFDFGKYEYYSIKKNKLVLKISNSGRSLGIHIGADTDETEWQMLIHFASQEPEKWTVQEYVEPYINTIIPHFDEKPVEARVLYGIFVIPDIEDNTQFDIDIVLKGYTGKEEYFKFDPVGKMKDIYFGNVIIKS